MWLYKVAYVGWEFSGSQVQPDRRTVEGDLRELLGRCSLLSRTDAGVSALGNVLPLEERINPDAVSSKLRDIVLWAEAEGEPKVHSRRYRYFLLEPPEADLSSFEGTHDFAEYTKSRENTVRTVHVEEGTYAGVDYVDFVSKGFLWNQVRRMVGGGRTAPPWPLVLMDISFEDELEWEVHPRWLKTFQDVYLKRLSQGLVARTLSESF